MKKSVFAAIKPFIQAHKIDILCVIFLLLIAGIPRLLDLGTFLTADEKNWIGRSYEYIRAFKDFRFNDMLQTTHPGATTLWLVGVAVALKMALVHVPFSFANLIYFVTASQTVVAAANTIIVVGVYFFLKKLLGSRVWAIVATSFIALDPFLIGYSRVAHVDALLAGFLLLTCLALIIYVQEQYNRRWLIISSVCFALAMLTKVPAIFAVPFFILAVLLKKPTMFWHKEFVRERGRDFVIWFLLATLLFLIIWPALVLVPNPEGNVLVLKRDISIATLTPHNMTEEYTLNPWLYPAALITRTTPLTLVLALFFIGTVAYTFFTDKISRASLYANLLLIAYVFFFVLMMTLGAKKGDRYILPVFPMLSILAALGLKRLLILLADTIPSISYAKFFIGGVAVATLFFGITDTLYHPYAIAYSNPFLPDNLSQELGWGEGLEQVGSWLSTNDPESVVASWYPEELATFTSAHVAHINAHEQLNVRYVVLYRNMFGRAPDHPANDFIDEYFKKKDPVFVARVVGKDFAWVYKKRVYTQVVGELLPGKRIGQFVVSDHGPIAGLDILLATYSGRADRGLVHVVVRKQLGGVPLYEWTLPVSEIEDGKYTSFMLPEGVAIDDSRLLVEVFAEGTTTSHAPTIRYTNKDQYRPDSIFIGTSGPLTASDSKPGNMGIRLLYTQGASRVTEDDTKLLQGL